MSAAWLTFNVDAIIPLAGTLKLSVSHDGPEGFTLISSIGRVRRCRAHVGALSPSSKKCRRPQTVGETEIAAPGPFQ